MGLWGGRLWDLQHSALPAVWGVHAGGEDTQPSRCDVTNAPSLYSTDDVSTYCHVMHVALGITA